MLKEKPQGAATPSGLVDSLNNDAPYLYQVRTNFATDPDLCQNIGNVAYEVLVNVVTRHYGVSHSLARVMLQVRGIGGHSC